LSLVDASGRAFAFASYGLSSGIARVSRVVYFDSRFV
jgi:hypothetical protein